MKTHSSQRQNKLVKDIHALRGDVVRLYSDLTQMGRTRAMAAGSKFGSLANDRLEGVEQALKVARGRGQDAIAHVQRKVEENPLPSLLISFGVGFIFGKILHRR